MNHISKMVRKNMMATLAGMPVRPDFSDTDINNLVAYIRSMKK